MMMTRSDDDESSSQFGMDTTFGDRPVRLHFPSCAGWILLLGFGQSGYTSQAIRFDGLDTLLIGEDPRAYALILFHMGLKAVPSA